MPMRRSASANSPRAPIAIGQASRDPRWRNRASPDGGDVAPPGVALAWRERVSCSAADIRGVEARGLCAREALGWDLDQCVVAAVGVGVLEDREAARDD